MYDLNITNEMQLRQQLSSLTQHTCVQGNNLCHETMTSGYSHIVFFTYRILCSRNSHNYSLWYTHTFTV